MTRVAINGLGRIGRRFLRLSLDCEDIKVVAINELGTIDSAAHLLKYDSIFGILEKNIQIEDQNLIIDPLLISAREISKTSIGVPTTLMSS